jgi:hypothetical protein
MQLINSVAILETCEVVEDLLIRPEALQSCSLLSVLSAQQGVVSVLVTR